MRKGKTVKISAKFLLSSVFVFLPAIGCAQDDYFVPQKDCGSLRAFGNTTIVEELADKQACIIGNQIQLKASVENLRFRVSGNEIDIKILEDKLKQTLLETKIELLEANLHSLERRLSMAEDEIEWLTPKAPASKPKAAVSKPKTTASKPATEWNAQGKPIQPITKPKAPVSKPTPTIKEGPH